MFLESGVSGELTVKICRADERDMDTEIPVVGRAIKTEVNAERNRRPSRIFCAAIEAYLPGQFPGKRSSFRG